MSSSLRLVELFAYVRRIVKFLCLRDCRIDAGRLIFLIRTMPAAAIATVAATTQEVSGEDHQSVFEVIIKSIHQRRSRLVA